MIKLADLFEPLSDQCAKLIRFIYALLRLHQIQRSENPVTGLAWNYRRCKGRKRKRSSSNCGSKNSEPDIHWYYKKALLMFWFKLKVLIHLIQMNRFVFAI